MMASLYLYFGWIGIASILLWMLSALIALNYAGHPFRNTYFARALAVLFAAWLFALANSGNVDRIEVDQTAELRALEERRKTEIQQLQERAAKVRYAEDDKLDALDLAGIQNASSLSVYERALLSKGIKPRKAGAKKSGGKPEEELTLAGAEEVSAFDESADEGVKRLPMNEVLAAASLDSMNRWAIRIIAILILLAMLHDYLRRFNQTASAPFPLPIGSQALDALFPKAHSTALRAREPGLVRDFLALVTRKGEPFIYFGAADIVGTQALPRLYLPFFEFPRLLANAFSTRRVGSPKACALKKKIMRWLAVPFAAIGILLRFAGGFLLRGFHALLRILPSWARQSNHATRRLKHHATIASSRLRVFARNLARGFVSEFPMPVISLAPGQSTVSETFVFESAWFRRYSFVVQGFEEARSHIAFLHDFLDARFHPNAAARHTVNIVWDHDADMPDASLRDLALLARESNFKLVVFARESRIPNLAGVLDEITPDETTAEMRPTVLDRLFRLFKPARTRIMAWIKGRRDKRAKTVKAPPADKAALPAKPGKAKPEPVPAPKVEAPAPKPAPKEPPAPAVIPPAPAPKTEAPAPKPAPIVKAPTIVGDKIVVKAKPPTPPAPAPKPAAVETPAPKPAPAVMPPAPAPKPAPKEPPAPQPAPAVKAPTIVGVKTAVQAKPPTPPAPAPKPAAVEAPAPKPAPAVKPPAPAPKVEVPAPKPAPIVKAPTIVGVKTAVQAKPPTPPAPAPKPAAVETPVSKPAPAVIPPAPAPKVEAPAPKPAPTEPPAPQPAPAVKAPAPAPKPAAVEAPVPKPAPAVKSPTPQPAPIVKAPTIVGVKTAVKAKPLTPPAPAVKPPAPAPKVEAPVPKPAPAVKSPTPQPAPVVKAPTIVGVKTAVKAKLPMSGASAIQPAPAAIPIALPSTGQKTASEIAIISPPVPAAMPPEPTEPPAKPQIQEAGGHAGVLRQNASSEIGGTPSGPPVAMPTIVQPPTGVETSRQQPISRPPDAAPRPPVAQPVDKPPAPAPKPETKAEAPKPAPAAPVQAAPAPARIGEINQAEQVFKFFCPACNRKLSANFKFQGLAINCPNCKSRIVLPRIQQ
ncbi:MAG: hypothetical protein GX608_09905 [Lentisphaerae bacterium]|nr:hypothetical protein [Lentisphaerota bacterium]